MNTELSSKYDPSSVESQAYRVWLEEKCFHADPEKPGEPYTIVIPPPNVTGALHLGHAINNTLQDILIRRHRMAGFNTLWIPGIDHAGIATQAVVEKQLKEQENKTRHDVGREGLIERIWQWKQQYGERILEQLKRLGASCDWDRTRFTLDEMCARAVRETFFKLFKDGLIYRGKRLVNWDTFLQTSISDDEIYHETVKTSLWHIRYPIVDGGTGFQPVQSAQGVGKSSPTESPHHQHGLKTRATATHMTVATTRPETMLADTAVAVHSEDPRWNWAIGKFVKLPLTGRLVPIIADDILVDPKFGTGVVKVTPAHDPNDYAVWQRHKGQPDEIDILNLLTPEGRINNDRPEWSKYAGMKRDAARKQVVEDLKSAGLLEKEEPYETQVGHSDRSKTPIEPYLSDQWFVKMAPLAEPALQVVREGIIKFFPERYAQTYLSWLGEKRDWPISRQLWWGHRIPVWRLPQDNNTPLDKRMWAGGSPLATWIRSNRVVISVGGKPVGFTKSGDLNLNVLDAVADDVDVSICIRDAEDTEVIRAIESIGFVQDPDVLDTWFSSALWPHSTLGWPEDTPELRKYYPTSVLVTGRDIITLWVARMVMMGMYNMGEGTEARRHEGTKGEEEGSGFRVQGSGGEGTEGRRDKGTEGDVQHVGSASADVSDSSLNPEPRTLNPSSQHSALSTQHSQGRALGIPFFHVAINPTILDGKGERMSKSKGNGVDPVDIIDSYGADALRFTLTKMATETQDARMPVKKDAQGRNTSEKFDEGRNFCNKLWNACRFALMALEEGWEEGTKARRHEGTKGEEGTEGQSDKGTKGNTQSSPQHSALNTQHSSPSLNPEPRTLNPSFDESKWSLPDRWIVSRFNRTVDEANKALESYRFDVYAKACYDFFWRDFCDWYVEAIKPALKDPARRAQTAHVLAAVIDGSLRLMHPMIPFITETVWWRLNEVRPTRGLPGRLECPPSKRLVLAKWPGIGDFSEASEHIFPKLQEIISAIRNVRNEHQVNPKQTVSVSIRAASEPTRQIEGNREMIELLATCNLKQVGPNIASVANAATMAVATCEIFVEGLVDPNAERQRLSKSIDDTKKNIDSIKARLSNEAYIAKAPPHLVQQSRDQLAALEAELKKLQEALRKVES